MHNPFAAFFRSAQRRRQYQALQHLDDRLLSDIGLTRHDVVQLMAGQRTAHSGAANG